MKTALAILVFLCLLVFTVKSETSYDTISGKDRMDYIVDYLADYPVTKLSNEDINILVRIMELESCRDYEENDCLSLQKTPPVYVKHCERKNMTYYVVEIQNGKQAYCGLKDIEVFKEKSWGPAQILESTGRRQCGIDVKNVHIDDYLDCVVKIKEGEGFEAWGTYRLI